jgi:hypothetical protein
MSSLLPSRQTHAVKDFDPVAGDYVGKPPFYAEEFVQKEGGVDVDKLRIEFHEQRGGRFGSKGFTYGAMQNFSLVLRQSDVVALGESVSGLPPGETPCKIIKNPESTDAYTAVLPEGKGLWLDLRSNLSTFLRNSILFDDGSFASGYSFSPRHPQNARATFLVQIRFGNVDALTGKVIEDFEPLRITNPGGVITSDDMHYCTG